MPSLNNDGFDEPHEVTQLQLAFPAEIDSLLPPWDTIPEPFRAGSPNDEVRPWREFQSRWFFAKDQGDLASLAVRVHDNINPIKALRHLAVIQRSFDPPHEHKEAAVAWLASRWFVSVVETGAQAAPS